MKKEELNTFNLNMRLNIFLNKELRECTTEAEKDAVREVLRINIAEGTEILAAAEKREEEKQENRRDKQMARNRERKRKAYWRKKNKDGSTDIRKKYSPELKEKVIRILSSDDPPTQAALAELMKVPRNRISRWWCDAIEDGIVQAVKEKEE